MHFFSSITSFLTNISSSLIELIFGIVAGNTIKPEITEWINFLAIFGAVVLTFLAGTEEDIGKRQFFWVLLVFLLRLFLFQL